MTPDLLDLFIECALAELASDESAPVHNNTYENDNDTQDCSNLRPVFG